MPKGPINYTRRRTLRFKQQTDDQLVAMAKHTGLEVSSLGRIIIELAMETAGIELAIKKHKEKKHEA